MNINRKGIQLDTRCPVCYRFDEDGAHCFLKCKAVRQCWRELSLETFRGRLLQSQSAKEFVQEILILKPDICLRVMVLLWHWWDVRNKTNAGELMPSCQDTVGSVIRMVRDIQETEPMSKGLPKKRVQKWSPPPPDTLKINFDGSFKQETMQGTWGFIIRNHEGSAVLAGTGNLGAVHGALLAETMACKQALEAAEHFGMSHIVIETDSTLLKEAITSSASDLAIGGGLFRDIRGMINDNFSCSSIGHVPRSCNSSAHELASMSMSWDPGQFIIWTDPLPEIVTSLAARDLAEHASSNTRP